LIGTMVDEGIEKGSSYFLTPEFGWRRWGKLWNIWRFIRSEWLPNTNLEQYRYANPLAEMPCVLLISAFVRMKLQQKSNCKPWWQHQHRPCKHWGFEFESRPKATGYGLDAQGVRVRVLVGASFSPLDDVQSGSGAHSVSYPIGTGGSFPGCKADGAWDYSPPTCAEVKNNWIYTCTPPYVFME
jgi:hypothetical protein